MTSERVRVFIDLDGTLVDAAPGIVSSIQYAFSELGRPIPPATALLECIGPPLHVSLLPLLDYDAPLAARALELYRKRYRDIGMYESTVYSGIPEALESLAATGARLFLATSKLTEFARRITSHFGLHRFFKNHFGAELDGTRGHKTDLLAYALSSTGDGPSIMIGDRRQDILAAHANCTVGIGACWGYGGRCELVNAGADGIAEVPQELPLVVSAFFGSREA